MTWEDKIQRIKQIDGTNLTVVLFSGLTETGAPRDFLEKVRMRWSFLPGSYLRFLAITDGGQVDLFVLYGSGRSKYPALFEENDRRAATNKELIGSVAIGEDAAGEPFLIRPSGAVYIQASDPPREPTLVAASFDDLLDQVMLGPRYELFFSMPRKHSEWGDFLRSEGWIPPHTPSIRR